MKIINKIIWNNELNFENLNYCIIINYDFFVMCLVQRGILWHDFFHPPPPSLLIIRLKHKVRQKLFSYQGIVLQSRCQLQNYFKTKVNDIQNEFIDIYAMHTSNHKVTN